MYFSILGIYIVVLKVCAVSDDADLTICGDDTIELYLDGKLVFDGKNMPLCHVHHCEIKRHTKLIAVKVRNK